MSQSLRLLCKRGFDIVICVLLLIISSPMFAVISMLVAIDGGPVFFAHKRVGAAGRSFNCYKFRTMIVGAQACFEEYLSLHPEQAAEWQRNQKLEFDPRITGIGKLLRKTSLDELPQLLNVLMGSMSLVGPRPVTENELGRYGEDAKYYRSTRPGITGLWQVSGRNRLPYAQRVALDRKYVTSISFWNDFRILLKTIPVVLHGDGK